MGRPLHFWFVKDYDAPFEKTLDVVRELLNDSGAREYAVKGIEITAEAGHNPIHMELTAGSAGKLRGIYLGDNPDTLSPAFAPRPSISRLLQFRDFAIAAMTLANPLPQESLMELSARLSHKVGPIMLMNADESATDGYAGFEDGNVSFYGFKYTEEFIVRLYGGAYKIDIYELGPRFEHIGIGRERITEAARRSGMEPCEINIHEEEMVLPFWHLSLEGLNLFYGLKLKNIGTWECNLATLDRVSAPGVALYDIFPDGVSYSYPPEPAEKEKKPWWKIW